MVAGAEDPQCLNAGVEKKKTPRRRPKRQPPSTKLTFLFPHQKVKWVHAGVASYGGKYRGISITRSGGFNQRRQVAPKKTSL